MSCLGFKGTYDEPKFETETEGKENDENGSGEKDSEPVGDTEDENEDDASNWEYIRYINMESTELTLYLLPPHSATYNEYYQ